jgi:hypothetical protein
MPLQENIDTYQYFICQADVLDLGYICLVRYVPAADPRIDGRIVHIAPYPVIEYFRRPVPCYEARRGEDIPPVHQEIVFLPQR